MGPSLNPVWNTGFKKEFYFECMKAELMKSERTPVGQKKKERKEAEEKDPVQEVKGYEMLVGEGMESKEARNRFIDSVENLLEFKSLEHGQQHTRKNFDYAAAHSEMYELRNR